MKPRKPPLEVDTGGPYFNTAKDRDLWIERFTKGGKVKVYNSLSDFKNRKS